MAASPRACPPSRTRTFGAGLLGGIFGTAGMIIVGIAAEKFGGVALSQLAPELELGFGGAWAGAGSLSPDLSFLTHMLHGVALGGLFAGFVLLGDHWGLAPKFPAWAGGLAFGVVVSAVVLLLLVGPESVHPTWGLVGLVCLLHLTFGGLAGTVVGQIRDDEAALLAARGRM